VKRHEIKAMLELIAQLTAARSEESEQVVSLKAQIAEWRKACDDYRRTNADLRDEIEALNRELKMKDDELQEQAELHEFAMAHNYMEEFV
jgi:cell division protein FtsB